MLPHPDSLKWPRLGALVLALALAVPVLGAEWTLVWADEFEYAGAPDPAKWTHQLGAGGWGNGEVQTYTDLAENSRVEGGRLIIEVQQKMEGSRTPTYTSARLITRGKAQWKYGRMEIRAKLPRETGTWSAIWMLAANTVYGNALWPDNGEIDIMEHVGYKEDPAFKSLMGDPQLHNLHGTLHTAKRNGRDNQGIGGSIHIADATSAFRTYATNWHEDRIEFEIDGLVYHTIFRADVIPARNPPADPWEYWPFNQPFYLILNVAMGGDWGGVFNPTLFPGQSPYLTDGINHAGVWPQRMEVEYVRIYAEAATGPTWKGLPTDAAGNVDTQDLLGWINVTHSPWLYAHSLQRFIYAPGALEEVFPLDGQWIFLPR